MPQENQSVEPIEDDAELSAADQARIDRIVAMRTREAKEAEQRVLAAAEARFERLMAEERARTQVESYAQHITTPTLSRQYALPGQASSYSAFLLSLNLDQRKAATGLFDGILSAGLVSFEEIGATGDESGQPSAVERYEAAVAAKVATGMTRSAALSAVNTSNPALMREYNEERAAAAPRSRGAAQTAKAKKD